MEKTFLRLGKINHTQRHWRATQLADTVDPFTQGTLHRATMPSLEYVDRAESRRLGREEEADSNCSEYSPNCNLPLTNSYILLTNLTIRVNSMF